MPVVEVNDLSTWRASARALLAGGVPPEQVVWQHASGNLALPLERDQADAAAPVPALRVPRDLLALLEAAACHREPQRWALMYRVLWRVQQGERHLLHDAADTDLHALHALARAVDRDCHKMHAFVRFRASSGGTAGERYVAWFEPQHHILRRVAPFFVDRFAGMAWTIVTPDGAIEWDRTRLQFIHDPTVIAMPASDIHEDLWRAYYAAIFNPSRANDRALRREMPVRYWRNLPEAQDIAALQRSAAQRVGRMLETAPADADRRAQRANPRPQADERGALQEAVAACRRCPLWRDATQAVCGAGPVRADLMLVGEQPGDEEDLRGAPFVGPAGRLLDRALAEAGLARDVLYITNAVKHFKWEPRGKRRMHKTPAQSEVAACLDWLEQEIATVQPRVIVALGVTALHALARSRESLADARHRVLQHRAGARLVATYHPAAVLRAESAAQSQLFAALRDDLRRAQTLVARPQPDT
jgi:DNA polymerase